VRAFLFDAVPNIFNSLRFVEQGLHLVTHLLLRSAADEDGSCDCTYD